VPFATAIDDEIAKMLKALISDEDLEEVVG
jgi:hypothetical protein